MEKDLELFETQEQTADEDQIDHETIWESGQIDEDEQKQEEKVQWIGGSQ